MTKAFTIWKLFGFLLWLLGIVPYLAGLLALTLLGCLIDTLCTHSDKKVLTEKQVETRKTDRFAKRADFFFNGILNYVMMLCTK